MDERHQLLAININNVTKKFDDKLIVHSTSLQLLPGKIYTLIGPNGAGKTTLIKMIVGLLTPTSGTISLFDKDIFKDPVETKRLFGYISDDPTVYKYLSGYEFLVLTGKLRGMHPDMISRRIDELKDKFDLHEIFMQPMAYYSRGNMQKIALLSALLDQPKLLFIDEPIVGLDPTSIEIFGKVLKDFKDKGGTVFFVTHTLPFADLYADHVFIMKQGKIIFDTQITSHTSLNNLYEDAISK